MAHGCIVKQSYSETVLVTILFKFKLSATAVEAPFNSGCAFSMPTGPETETVHEQHWQKQGQFHSLSAHHHNANK